MHILCIRKLQRIFKNQPFPERIACTDIIYMELTTKTHLYRCCKSFADIFCHTILTNGVQQCIALLPSQTKSVNYLRAHNCIKCHVTFANYCLLVCAAQFFMWNGLAKILRVINFQLLCVCECIVSGHATDNSINNNK